MGKIPLCRKLGMLVCAFGVGYWTSRELSWYCTTDLPLYCVWYYCLFYQESACWPCQVQISSEYIILCIYKINIKDDSRCFIGTLCKVQKDLAPQNLMTTYVIYSWKLNRYFVFQKNLSFTEKPSVLVLHKSVSPDGQHHSLTFTYKDQDFGIRRKLKVL